MTPIPSRFPIRERQVFNPDSPTFHPTGGGFSQERSTAILGIRSLETLGLIAIKIFQKSQRVYQQEQEYKKKLTQTTEILSGKNLLTPEWKSKLENPLVLNNINNIFKNLERLALLTEEVCKNIAIISTENLNNLSAVPAGDFSRVSKVFLS